MQANPPRKLSIDFLLNDNSIKKAEDPHPLVKLQELADVAVGGKVNIPKRRKMLKRSPLSSSSPHSLSPAVFMTLRMQAYCNMMNEAIPNNDSRYGCPFDNSCVKTVKGKGNLRRHIEWHLQKMEGEFKELVDLIKNNKV